MEHLVQASHEGDINLLYTAIQRDPTILDKIDSIPFVNTPLHVAASCGHVEFAMEVARLKPSFTRKPNPEGLTPMHVALNKDKHEMVSWMLSSDSELARVKGREGVTPLHIAVRKGQVAAVEMLLSSCFRSIEDLTNRNETAFHVALKSGQLPAFHLLLERLQKEGGKVILDAKDLEGNTVLHVASAMNQAQAIESLQKWFGMLSTDAPNENRQAALEIETAVAHHHSSVERISSQATPKQNSTTNNSNATIEQPAPAPAEDETAVPLSRDEIIDWAEYFKFRFGTTDPETTRTNLLVVTVLMATATYTAVLTPPGGVNDTTGLSRLADKLPVSYIWFMTCNSAGFFVSMTTIIALIYNCPLFWEIYMAIFAMEVTYDFAMVSTTPQGWMRNVCIFVSIVMPIVIPMGYHYFRRWCLCRGRRRKLRRSSTTYARV